jgi:hypothetical protein
MISSSLEGTMLMIGLPLWTTPPTVLNLTSTTVPLTGATTTVRCRTSALACNLLCHLGQIRADLLRIGGEFFRAAAKTK